MSSSNSINGVNQRRGSCGHQMAAFDQHRRCVRCREAKKGDDPCVAGKECQICRSFTPQQLEQLAAPNRHRQTKNSAARDPALLEPAGSTVDERTGNQPRGRQTKNPAARDPAMLEPADHSTEESGFDTSTDTPADAPTRSRPAVRSPGRRNASPSTSPKKKRQSKKKDGDEVALEQRLEQMIADRMNRMEALFRAKAFTADATAPVQKLHHQPVAREQPFFQPPSSATNNSSKTLPGATLPSSSGASAQLTETPSVSGSKPTSEGIAEVPATAEEDIIELSPAYSDSESDMEVSSREPLPLPAEAANIEGPLVEKPSDDQTYRETVRGVRCYMKWDQVPDFEASVVTENNPFAAPRERPVGKVSIALPIDDWLCKKLDRINLTLENGYPSVTSESAPLPKDNFIRHNTGVSRWYDLYKPDGMQEMTDGKATCWSNAAAKINAGFPRIARAAISHKPPPSRPITQENLRRWERATKNRTYICNQAAGFSRCLTKLHGDIDSQVDIVSRYPSGHAEHQKALDELRHLLTFNAQVTVSMKKSIQDLTDTAFHDLANIVLLRRDAYLDNLKLGVKPDTAALLRLAPVHLNTLFAEDVVTKAEKEVSDYDNRMAPPRRDRERSSHPYKHSTWNQGGRRAQRREDKPAWKQVGQRSAGAKGGKPDKPSFPNKAAYKGHKK